jgi:hypothetical protein
MNKLILILVFLLTPLVSLAETLQTNIEGVTVKNFQCTANRVSFNVVNKSDKNLSFLHINIFDSDNDPIDKIWIDLSYLAPNSGKEYSKSFVQCNKFTRIGITVNK